MVMTHLPVRSGMSWAQTVRHRTWGSLRATQRHQRRDQHGIASPITFLVAPAIAAVAVGSALEALADSGFNGSARGAEAAEAGVRHGSAIAGHRAEWLCAAGDRCEGGPAHAGPDGDFKSGEADQV